MLSSSTESIEMQFKDKREVDLRDLVTVLRRLSHAEREIFTAMRRLKTYLHSTIGQRKLNAII